MWILKLKVKEEWNLYNKRTLKFKVRIHFYSHNYYVKNNKVYFVGSGIVIGDEKNKKAFFEDLKKDRQIEEIEINNDFFVSVYSEKETSERINALKTVYNSKIIFIKPAVVDEEGFEEWEVASFDRRDLEEIIKQAEKLKRGEFKLISFKEKKINNLMVESILPDLSEQQRKAFELALENDYYGYPRKVKLVDLAKKMNISVSTYQFHLAKAEAKLMPFFSKKL
ncbi:MAG: helix-turn-helix domain-containing protein [Candidatus Pacearchaeota archaeon]|nr:helix-turn-helix domain-containing protein [Candidatus Pacearchaeota archaeon]